MKDLVYYLENRKRYEQAIPKLRTMIEYIECELKEMRIIAHRIVTDHIEDTLVIKSLESKRASLLIQLGRLNGILAVLNEVKNHMIITYNEMRV